MSKSGNNEKVGNEKDKVQRVLDSDIQLKRLFTQHLNIDKKLQDYNSKSFLTHNEQMEAKLLKKQKLAKKDEMMSLLATHSQ